MSKKEQAGNNIPKQKNEAPKMALDDAARVKVLSPSRLVFKRFIRNKLAIFGTCVLVFLFLFCFLGPLFYPYGETQVFKGWREQNANYAYAQIRTEYVSFWNPNVDADLKKSMSFVERNVNSTIKKMQASTNEADKLTYKI
jgi:peptide/nickel transport system permease protein